MVLKEAGVDDWRLSKYLEDVQKDPLYKDPKEIMKVAEIIIKLQNVLFYERVSPHSLKQKKTVTEVGLTTFWALLEEMWKNNGGKGVFPARPL